MTGGTMVKEDRHTIKVIQRDGNQFVLVWELHDIFRKWKFTGTLAEVVRRTEGCFVLGGSDEFCGVFLNRDSRSAIRLS